MRSQKQRRDGLFFSGPSSAGAILFPMCFGHRCTHFFLPPFSPKCVRATDDNLFLCHSSPRRTTSENNANQNQTDASQETQTVSVKAFVAECCVHGILFSSPRN